MNPNNLVCRTCLGVISEGKVTYNIDDENGVIKNVRNIREMILFCIPEMDIYISVNPVICESCIGALVNIYNFKIRCLRVENAIRVYIETNNVMEGSCVNLNNVVRQQIVEALKQKNWSPSLINDYVNKYLCTAAPPSLPSKPPADLFQAMAQKINTAMGNVRPSNNVESEPAARSLSPPNPGVRQVIFKPPPSGGNYISVNQNLMPPRPEHPPQTQHLEVSSRLNTTSVNPVDQHSAAPAVPGSAPLVTVQGTTSLFAGMDDFQNAFLTALQLASTASGGREEAVLMKKKKKKTVHKNAPGARPINNATRNLVNPVHLALNPLNPGLMGKSLVQGLRDVRRRSSSSKISGNNSVTECLESNDVIVLDDEPETERQIVGNELLLMNFEENDVSMNEDKQSTSQTPGFMKQIVVKLPMIDPETLKRKLKPKDVIEEIESKRRKLVVKLSSSLPYLHKNKRLLVKVQQDKFFSCGFCNVTKLQEKELRTHYMEYHKVCTICGFKCDRALLVTAHINARHPLELKEALKRCNEETNELHCYLCNFIGLSYFDLRDHRLRIHIKCNVKGMYQCPYLTCVEENPIAYDMNKHIEKVHDRLRQVQCPLCNYIGRSAFGLKKHIETHSLSRVKCHLCTYQCKTSFSLKLHVKNAHPKKQDDGMVCNDDYRITLKSLLTSTTDTQTVTARRDNYRSLDQYEFALPSLSEMLCNQLITEEASDQEGDCTIVVSDPQKDHKTDVKNTNSEENTVDDSEDCMIVIQDIPTFDLSDDDDDDEPTVKKRKEDQENSGSSSKGSGSSSDVIEIEDNNEDYITSSDAAVAAKIPTLEPSEIDTRSEIIAGPNKEAVSGSETDTASEIDILSQKRRSETAEDLGVKDKMAEDLADVTGALEEQQGDASKEETLPQKIVKLTGQCASPPTDNETRDSENAIATHDAEFSELSSENAGQDCNTDQIKDKCSGDQEKTDLPLEDKITCGENKPSEDADNSAKESEVPKTQREVLNSPCVDATTCSESFVIESSDEESDECTFVSESSCQEDVERVDKEPECDQIGEEKDVSEVSRCSSNKGESLGEDSNIGEEKHVSETLKCSSNEGQSLRRDSNDEEEKDVSEVPKCSSNKGESLGKDRNVGEETDVSEVPKCSSDEGESLGKDSNVGEEKDVSEIPKCSSNEGESLGKDSNVGEETDVSEVPKCSSNDGESLRQDSNVGEEKDVSEIPKCSSNEGESLGKDSNVGEETDVSEVPKCSSNEGESLGKDSNVGEEKDVSEISKCSNNGRESLGKDSNECTIIVSETNAENVERVDKETECGDQSNPEAVIEEISKEIDVSEVLKCSSNGENSKESLEKDSDECTILSEFSVKENMDSENNSTECDQNNSEAVEIETSDSNENSLEESQGELLQKGIGSAAATDEASEAIFKEINTEKPNSDNKSSDKHKDTAPIKSVSASDENIISAHNAQLTQTDKEKTEEELLNVTSGMGSENVGTSSSSQQADKNEPDTLSLIETELIDLLKSSFPDTEKNGSDIPAQMEELEENSLEKIDSGSKGFDKSTDIVPTELVPSSDGNAFVSDPNSKSSEHREDDVELSKEKTTALMGDSGVNTDTGMQSGLLEMCHKLMDIEKEPDKSSDAPIDQALTLESDYCHKSSNDNTKD